GPRSRVVAGAAPGPAGGRARPAAAVRPGFLRLCRLARALSPGGGSGFRYIRAERPGAFLGPAAAGAAGQSDHGLAGAAFPPRGPRREASGRSTPLRVTTSVLSRRPQATVSRTTELSSGGLLKVMRRNQRYRRRLLQLLVRASI